MWCMWTVQAGTVKIFPLLSRRVSVEPIIKAAFVRLQRASFIWNCHVEADIKIWIHYRRPTYVDHIFLYFRMTKLASNHAPQTFLYIRCLLSIKNIFYIKPSTSYKSLFSATMNYLHPGASSRDSASFETRPEGVQMFLVCLDVPASSHTDCLWLKPETDFTLPCQVLACLGGETQRTKPSIRKSTGLCKHANYLLGTDAELFN